MYENTRALPATAADDAPPAAPRALIDDLAQSNRRHESRVRELEAAADALRRQFEVCERRLQMIMARLADAEDRAGHRTLAGAIRSVASGQSNLSFDDAWALIGEHARDIAHAQTPDPHLGAREREVLRLLTEGHRSPVIAGRLGIKVATVEVHRRNIMRKIGLHTVAELTKYAVREGLTTL